MNTDPTLDSSCATRRSFLGRMAAAGAAVAAPGLLPSRAQGANDRLGVGFIGCGGRAGAHMDMVRRIRDGGAAVDLVACCDIYRPRVDRRKQEFGFPRSYRDHRELLADPDIDVVCVATPDHWHAGHATDAVKAGKHVYCEKPVSHWSQFEATKQLADAVAAAKVAFVCSTQALSDPVWRQMKKLVAEGVIGQPVHAETGFFRTGDWGERGMPVDDPNAKPGPDLDWEAFLGPDRPQRPFSVDRFFRWRLFEDYAGGPATDLYPHCLAQVMDVLGLGFPETVTGLAGTFRYPDPLREVPDTFQLLAQFPNKVALTVQGTQANDFQSTPRRGAGQRCPVIRGWEGALTLEGNREIVFHPAEGSSKQPQKIPIEGGEDNVALWRNLLDAARAGSKETWSPMDLAFRTQTVLQMAMLSSRAGKVCRFDAAQRAVLV